MILYRVLFFFFVQHKTAYEMRISDWSSDLCSSDLWITGIFRSSGLSPGERSSAAPNRGAVRERCAGSWPGRDDALCGNARRTKRHRETHISHRGGELTGCRVGERASLPSLRSTGCESGTRTQPPRPDPPPRYFLGRVAEVLRRQFPTGSPA